MSSQPQVHLIVPLESARPTGMGIAAAGVERFLGELQPGYRPPGINRWFRRLNDCPLPGAFRMILRLLLVQVAPLFCRGGLIFASHHAPLWKTGRHAVIIHDLISLHHPEQHPNQTRFFRRLLPRTAASAERVIAISDPVREDLLRVVSIAQERVLVIPSYSPKIDLYRPSSRSWEDRLRAWTFLFVGANFPHKNLDTAIGAIAALRGAGDEAGLSGAGPLPRLVVVGCKRKIWEARGVPLRELEKEGVLRIREYASEEELAELYQTATALLYLPSTEGMGMPPLEAMAAGCPAICSDIPVLRQTCGEAAFFVSPDAKTVEALLRRLLAGELNGEVAKKREAGFAQAKSFSAEALREKWREQLESGREKLKI